jgi:hypothetical protein
MNHDLLRSGIGLCERRSPHKGGGDARGDTVCNLNTCEGLCRRSGSPSPLRGEVRGGGILVPDQRGQA